MANTGIDPIRYKPWKGQRTGHSERVLVIMKTFFRHKLKSKWLLALIVLGIFIITAVSLFIYVLLPHDSLEASAMADLTGNPVTLILVIFLVSMICSDTISEDLRSNSFVLYFSRAIRAEDYLVGKMGGAALTLSLFSFFPSFIMAILIMATQSGSDYGTSLVVLGKTVLACIITTIYFLPFGLFVSSLTARKAYASVGTFMAISVLSIVAGAFSTFDRTWELVNPVISLSYFFRMLFGLDLADHVDPALVAAILAAFFFIPLVLVYARIKFRAVGK